MGADGASAPICCRGRPVMTSGELAIVIAGTREDWPGGGEDPDPARVPPGNRTGLGLSSPADRGRRLVNVLIVLITPDRQLGAPTSTASRSGSPRPAPGGSSAWGGEDGSPRARPCRGRARGGRCPPTAPGRPPSRRGPTVLRPSVVQNYTVRGSAGRVGEFDAEQPPGTGPGAPQRDPGRPHRGSRARVRRRRVRRPGLPVLAALDATAHDPTPRVHQYRAGAAAGPCRRRAARAAPPRSPRAGGRSERTGAGTLPPDRRALRLPADRHRRGERSTHPLHRARLAASRPRRRSRGDAACQATSGIDPPATPKTDPSKKRRMLLKWWVFR